MSRLAAVLEQESAERRAQSLGISAKPAGTAFGRRPKLVCCRRCTQFVAAVFGGPTVGEVTLLLDAVPFAGGEYVLIDDNWQPCAVAYDATLHSGWRRWNRHACQQVSPAAPANCGGEPR